MRTRSTNSTERASSKSNEAAEILPRAGGVADYDENL